MVIFNVIYYDTILPTYSTNLFSLYSTLCRLFNLITKGGKGILIVMGGQSYHLKQKGLEDEVYYISYTELPKRGECTSY